VCRYNWHSAGSLGLPFPTLYINIFSYKIYGSNFIKQHSETVRPYGSLADLGFFRGGGVTLGPERAKRSSIEGVWAYGRMKFGSL